MTLNRPHIYVHTHVHTCSFGRGNGIEEDADEPLQGVLVHGVYVGEVSGAEEEELCACGHGNVFAACDVNLQLRLLSVRHFGLK